MDVRVWLVILETKMGSLPRNIEGPHLARPSQRSSIRHIQYPTLTLVPNPALLLTDSSLETLLTVTR